MRRGWILALLFAGILSFGISEAVETTLIVRAKSKDAKFVGTSMGGAHIIIKDSDTGKVLSEGLTAGATGSTRKIMIEPVRRGVSIADDMTAKFETKIDIDEPRLLTIDVEAPYGQKPNVIKSSTQLWLIPGRDIVGDGMVIEVPGFSVDIDAPDKRKLVEGNGTIPIRARVVMI